MKRHTLGGTLDVWLVVVPAACLALAGCSTVNTKNFAEGMRVMAGQGGTVEERDTLKEILPVARDLATYQPKPRWQTVFRADAADLLEFVSPDRVLIGTVQLGSYLAKPSYADVQMYDARTGAKLWEGRRKDIPGGVYTLLAAEPVILLHGTSVKLSCFTALNPQTGQPVWEREYPQPGVAFLDGERGLLIAGPLTRQGVELSAYRIGDGSPAWSQVLPTARPEGGAKTEPEQVPTARDDRHLYVAADPLYGVSIESGQVIWKAPNPAGSSGANLHLADGDLLLYRQKSMWLVDRATGAPKWGPVACPGDVMAVSVPADAGGTAFLIARAGGAPKKDVVCAVSLADGKTLWTLAAPNLTQSPLLYTSGRLFFTTASSLECVDSRTGRSLSSTPFLAEWGWSFSEIPDVLVERNGRVLLASEKKGVAAFSVSDGKALWHQPLDLFYGAHYWYSTKETEFSNAALMSGQLRKLAAQDQRWWSNWVRAVDYQWSGYNYAGTYDARLKDPFGSNMVLFQNLLALSAGLEAALRQEALANLVLRKQMELNNAVALQTRAFQGKYWVRPYQKRGAAALIVDLDTGRRADVQFSAPDIAMGLYGVTLPCVRVAPDGGRLVTAGLGIDEAKFEKHVKFKLGMPYPSVLSYELAALRFGDHVWDDADLGSAASNGDVEKMKALLNGGAWVDARGILGNTALYEAAGKGQDEAVRLLLASGANVDYRSATAHVATALEMAAFNGHSSTAKILLDKGAQPGQAALFAAGRGHGQTLQVFREAGLLQVKSIEDAVGYGSAKDVSAYIKDAREVDRPLPRGTLVFADGTTPLMLASYLGNLETVRYLLDLGAAVNLKEKTAQQENALMKAAVQGHTDIVKLLIEKRAQVNATDVDGMTALYKAAQMGRVDTARLLLDSGAAVGTKTKLQEDSALLAAARFGHAETAKLLLDRGARVNETNSTKKTALMEAASNGHVAVAKVLLEAGAAANAKDANGHTALDIARAALVLPQEQRERMIALLEGDAKAPP